MTAQLGGVAKVRHARALTRRQRCMIFFILLTVCTASRRAAYLSYLRSDKAALIPSVYVQLYTVHVHYCVGRDFVGMENMIADHNT